MNDPGEHIDTEGIENLLYDYGDIYLCRLEDGETELAFYLKDGVFVKSIEQLNGLSEPEPLKIIEKKFTCLNFFELIGAN